MDLEQPGGSSVQRGGRMLAWDTRDGQDLEGPDREGKGTGGGDRNGGNPCALGSLREWRFQRMVAGGAGLEQTQVWKEKP